MPRDTVELEEPALSPRMALTVSWFSRWAAHNEAGHRVRAALWRAAADAIAP